MGKTRDVFKKIGGIKGIFHTRMGMIKGRNGKDLTEAEDIKKTWQVYTEELYKKLLNDPDATMVVIHLEPDILECEVKWALGSNTTNKANGDDGIPVAAAAKSLQPCPTLCDPIGDSPPGSPVPGILQARTLEWVAISFSNAWKWKVRVKSLSRIWPSVTPWTAALQAPPSMGFSRQEYWSGVLWNSSWTSSNPKSWCCESAALNMPANLEHSAVITGLEKVSFHSNAKAYSNYCTIALISHARKVMLKILHVRLQQYMNWELPDVQGVFRKGRGTRDQIANIRWIIEKAREFQ